MENNHALSDISPKNSLEELEAAAANISHDVRDNARELGSKLKEFTSEKSRQVRESAAFKKASATARDAGSAVDKQVRQNPFTAVGIAFGLGVLMASMLRR